MADLNFSTPSLGSILDFLPRGAEDVGASVSDKDIVEVDIDSLKALSSKS